MARFFMAIAAILAAISVAAGAFGAHALKARVSDRALEIFEVGTRYQMYHALGLLLVGILLLHVGSGYPLLNAAGVAFLTGIIVFSGSLYALSLTGIQWLGAITPLGGLAFVIGWALLAIAALHLKS
ncbi:MAG TPA: DUF423 domain-containing protein [Synechococcales cyanobacterium M55_K2018_004]|nr:DUF423 domain-containing protein [Synechococcales cyanobacterium M55_K2018_004]